MSACAVVFCTTWLSRAGGGLFTAMAPLAEELRRQGLRLSAVGVDDPHLRDDAAAWGDVPLVRLHGQRPYSLCRTPGMAAAIAAQNPDVVHQHGLWSWQAHAVSAWHRRSNRPYLVSPHGMLDPWILAHGRWKKALARWWFQSRDLSQAACVHALCAAERDHVRSAGLSGPVAVIANGVELPPDQTPPPAPWPADGRRTLLFLSRLHPKKGLDVLLDGWQGLLRDHPAVAQRWRLVIAGWGEPAYEAGLRAHPAQAHFTGGLFGAAKEGALARCDAFILPSHGEGLPMAVLEAWARRRPTLLSRGCNLPEGFAAGAAWEVDTQPAAIADAIARLDAAPTATLAEMGSAGHRLVEQRYTRDRVARAFHHLYEWILGGGPPPESVER